MSDTDDIADEQPEDQLRYDIADSVAALSDAVDTPTEIHAVGDSFDASAVDFESGTWMSRLAQVQGWLRLDNDLPEDVPAATFLPALARGLGLDPEQAIDASGGTPQFSLLGLNRLYERLALAVQYQQLFVAKFEEPGETRVSASEAWVDAWGETLDDADELEFKPVHASADTWPISEFSGRKLNLSPSYQRGDVWAAPARQALIESILRGIPLPSIILLKHEDPSKPHEVVDGKQRLTSILRFIGKHHLALERVRAADTRHDRHGELLQLFQDDYPTFKKLWKKLEGESLGAKVEEEYYFPFKLRSGGSSGLRGSLEQIQGKYYSEIKNVAVQVADDPVLIEELFALTSDYKIPVIVYRKADPRQIHEVFKLYNRQGLHLNAEELRNAAYHDIELTRALLLAAGDSGFGGLDDVAPSLRPIRDQVREIGGTLTDYGLGTSRYRRTKILSWLVAALLVDTRGKPLQSTTKHIDTLLEDVKLNSAARLNVPVVLGQLFDWIARSVKLHAELQDEMWAPQFRDATGRGGWQELQLVGSLISVALLCVDDPDGAAQRAADGCAAIFDASATAGSRESDWARPANTQSWTQWRLIGRVVRESAKLFGIDLVAAGEKIRRTYGTSGISSLLAAAVRDG